MLISESNNGIFCYCVNVTVSKWRAEAVMDDFDRSNAGSQSGFDDISYTGDPRRLMEVINFILSQ